MNSKKITAILISAALASSMCGMTAGAEDESKGIAILHTNDVHCGVYADDYTMGAAELAAYKARLESEGYEVILADAGDFIQGGGDGMTMYKDCNIIARETIVDNQMLI